MRIFLMGLFVMTNVCSLSGSCLGGEPPKLQECSVDAIDALFVIYENYEVETEECDKFLLIRSCKKRSSVHSRLSDVDLDLDKMNQYLQVCGRPGLSIDSFSRMLINTKIEAIQKNLNASEGYYCKPASNDFEACDPAKSSATDRLRPLIKALLTLYSPIILGQNAGELRTTQNPKGPVDFIGDNSVPELGNSFRDPSGLIWGEISIGEMNLEQALQYCERRSGRVPKKSEFEQLLEYYGTSYTNFRALDGNFVLPSINEHLVYVLPDNGGNRIYFFRLINRYSGPKFLTRTKDLKRLSRVVCVAKSNQSGGKE